jgi:beta-glucosidase-like glycosyl hydrolase
LHGIAFNGIALTFPQAIALAANWDTPLMKQVSNSTAIEGRAKYNDALRSFDAPLQDRGLRMLLVPIPRQRPQPFIRAADHKKLACAV